MSSEAPIDRPASPLAAVNLTTWATGDFVGHYAGRSLQPPEVLALIRFAEQARGRVLELGCGAGRISGYLVALAAHFHGLDLSPAMIAECRRRYPEGEFSVGDLRDLSRFADDSMDLVLAGCNLLDIFGDAERRQTLREIRRVIVPGGILIMSSHNRAYIPRLHRPWHVRLDRLRHGDPYGALQAAADIVRTPRRVAHHLRLRRLEVEAAEYAVVNDGAHEFSLVHYFIDNPAARRQLAEEAFEPLVSLDADGRELKEDDRAPLSPEIYYMARKPSP